MMFDDEQKPKTAKQGLLDSLGGGQDVNQAAGYDVGKWNGLDAATQQKYVVDGGAPSPMDASNGGINGAGLQRDPGGAVLDQALPSAPAAPVRDFSRLSGYDEGKFNANKNDAKYQMGGVLSGFDPRQGVTPEVLAGLNKLGYGTFSGQGDKLSLSGLTDAGRAANLQGDYKDADFIGGFKTGNGKWGYADPVEEAKQAAAAPQGGQMMPFMGSRIASPLQSSGSDNVQAALGQMGGAATDSSLLQKLIAQLGGGQ